MADVTGRYIEVHAHNLRSFISSIGSIDATSVLCFLDEQTLIITVLFDVWTMFTLAIHDGYSTVVPILQDDVYPDSILGLPQDFQSVTTHNNESVFETTSVATDGTLIHRIYRFTDISCELILRNLRTGDEAKRIFIKPIDRYMSRWR